MVDGHVLGSHSLGIDTVEEGNRTTCEDTGRDVTRFGSLLGWL